MEKQKLELENKLEEFKLDSNRIQRATGYGFLSIIVLGSIYAILQTYNNFISGAWFPGIFGIGVLILNGWLTKDTLVQLRQLKQHAGKSEASMELDENDGIL